MNRPKRISKTKLYTLIVGVIVLAVTAACWDYGRANAAPALRAIPDGTFTLVCTVQGGVVTECKPPAVTPSPTATATATPSPTPSPSASTPSSTPTPTPTTTPSTPPSGYPTAATTGVPAVTILTPYTGPCTITAPNTVIVGKTVNCSLSIRANNVIIRNSLVNGTVDNGTENQPQRSFQVINSDVIAPANWTAIGESNFRLIGSDVRGGNRGANCFQQCWIEGNFIHGNRITGSQHASGIRMGMETTVWGNTITCDVPDTSSNGGCSADLTGYPDFSPVRDNLITRNQFLPSEGYFCAYGGASAGKPYSSHPQNATNIRFIDNMFVRGPGGKCGGPSDGGPITDYARSRPGNLWSANHYDNGVVIPVP